MGRQTFAELINNPPIANLSAVTATTETELWSAAQYSPLDPIRDAGAVFRLTAGGIMSFASTGTLIITPRFGLTVGAGTSMGASVVALTTPGATTAHSWFLEMLLTVRSIGAPGANSVVVANGFFTTGIPSAGSLPATQVFGGTPATVDVSIASGICIGWTLSVAGTITPQQVVLQRLN